MTNRWRAARFRPPQRPSCVSTPTANRRVHCAWRDAGRDAGHDAQGVPRRPGQPARLLRRPGRRPGPAGRRRPRSDRLLPRPGRAGRAMVGRGSWRIGTGGRRPARGTRSALPWPASRTRRSPGTGLRGHVGPGLRCHLLGAQECLGAVGAVSRSVRPDRGPGQPRHGRDGRPRLAGAPRRRHASGTQRRPPGRHPGAGGSVVPPAHQPQCRPAAAHPRHHRRQGPGHHRRLALP